MGRKYIDCREVPTKSGCTIAISADREDELLEAAVQHSVACHGQKDTPALRDMIRHAVKDTKSQAAA